MSCFLKYARSYGVTLFQEDATNEITFYMKGADVVMSSVVQYNDWLEEEVSYAPFLSPVNVLSKELPENRIRLAYCRLCIKSKYYFGDCKHRHY